jgi:cell division control protein 6
VFYVLQVELSKHKILQITQTIKKSDSIFSAKRYLESLGSGSVIGRQDEAEKLVKLLHPSNDGFSLPFVSVFGKSGTGKSTLVRFVCDALSQVSSCFVNLRRADTHFGCANLILESLGGKPVKSSAGINSAINGIQNQIQETLAQDKKSNFVLILDEFDVIFSDKRRRGSDFLYKLFALSESLRSLGLWLCIVAISNSKLEDHSLEERVRSRMGGDYEVYFTPYAESDIFHILKQRAKKAFSQKPADDVLLECARLCAEESGDCRRALCLLLKTVEIAEGKAVVSDVQKASVSLNEDFHESMIQTCTVHQKAILLAMARLGWQNKSDIYSTKEIFEEYQSLRMDVHHLGYRRLFDLLDELENLGIVTSQKKSDGRFGYHKLYRLLVHYDLVGYLVSKEDWYKQLDEIIFYKNHLAEIQTQVKCRQELERQMRR